MSKSDIYVQVRFSRTDARSYTMGMTGFGERALEEAREMTRNLVRSSATTHIEVMTEKRDGANSSGGKVCLWSRSKGWEVR